MGDISTLAKRAIVEINELHLEILKLRQEVEETAIQKAIRLGTLLEEQKGKLEPRGWASWARENLEFSLTQADRYRRIAENHHKGLLVPGTRIDLKKAARKTPKVLDIEMTTSPSANGDCEPEKALKIGLPIEEQTEQPEEEPKVVIRRKLKLWFEYRRLTLAIIDDLKTYLKIAKFPRKVLKQEIKVCCAENEEARKILEKLLFLRSRILKP